MRRDVSEQYPGKLQLSGRAEVLFSPPTPAAPLFLGIAALNKAEDKALFNHQKAVPANHGTDFRLPSVPIMKFLKGGACTKAGAETILCGPANVHALLPGLLNGTRAAAERAKPFSKLEGLPELFSSLQDPLKPSASSSPWHGGGGGVDKIRSRLSVPKQKGVVKWAFKHWNLSSSLGGWRGGGARGTREVPSREWSATCEQSCREVIWLPAPCVRARSRACAEQLGRRPCAHEGGLGAGGRQLWRSASCSMGFLPSGFFFFLFFSSSPSPFPHPSPQTHANRLAGRAR